ncbi:hypothetical protein SNEBB_009976 [Seison nebaliae]|nr:hypothetical protein SNEBB_009976 [Seison nebaliae]
MSESDSEELPECPYGILCYRKNPVHFQEYSHPFRHETTNTCKMKKNETKNNEKIKKLMKEVDSDATESYSSSTEDEEMERKDISLIKTYSNMTEEERRLVIQKAIDAQNELKNELDTTKKEVEEKKEELKVLSANAVALMEGEDEALKLNDVTYFSLEAEREFKMNSPQQLHFRLAESQFYRLLSGAYITNMQIEKVEYIVSPNLIENFQKTKLEFEKKYPENEKYSSPILAFHGTDVGNIESICQNGFFTQKSKKFYHATDSGYWGGGVYFSEYPNYSMSYIKGATKILLCQVLLGKSYLCQQQMNGKSLMSGFDSHMSPNKKELIIFKTSQILPQYIVYYNTKATEFKYISKAINDPEIKKKIKNFPQIAKEANKKKESKILSGKIFVFDKHLTLLRRDMEALVEKHNGGYSTVPFPTSILICNEKSFSNNSDLVNKAKTLNVEVLREDYLYDSIIQHKSLPFENYRWIL